MSWHSPAVPVTLWGMKWLCVDLGAVRIGLAAGDSLTGIASPLAVIAATPWTAAMETIARTADAEGAVGIVVGWPLNMDDSEGPQGKRCRQQAVDLARHTGLDVRMWDERLSSFAADNALAGQLTRKKKKQWQDALAAATILQDFFHANGPATPDNRV